MQQNSVNGLPRKSVLTLTLIGMFFVSTGKHKVFAAEAVTDAGEVYVTAEQELKQSLGVSIITHEDIMKRPPANDLSEVIRTMPGVNLTGNGASGQRGNNRQIDIRGMGPENTLILIDGKPVGSRNSVRYGWSGERDTRGDSNWVPAEEVERIEVIRGPAAARYGSGAAGGVVNIITQKTSKVLKGSMSLYTHQPENSKEGATNRINFNLSGPVSETLSFRLYGNLNKTDADSPDINRSDKLAIFATPAGHEGVRNKDISSRLVWQVAPAHFIEFDAGFSRQGNIYAGDTQNNNANNITSSLANSGAETNILYRENFALTHNGTWDFGTSKFVLQYDHTNNARLKEGLAGATEGRIADNHSFNTNTLKSYRANGEINTDFYYLFNHVLTVGAELSKDSLNDSASLSQDLVGRDQIVGLNSKGANRDPKTKATMWGVYLEDNISIGQNTQLVPGLRLDHHDKFGNNWSPSLNISHKLSESFTLKGGIARAFKAPNLYQSNQNYLLFTRSKGCPATLATGSCYLVGNDNLKPEISVNKELGLQFEQKGWAASVAWFRNDYKNKIKSGLEPIALTANGNNVLQWSNAKKAVVEGIEGSILVPISKALTWNTNITYMVASKDKDTGNPLSIIPKHTINSALDWQVNEKFSTQLTLTNYGKQEPPHNSTSRVSVGRIQYEQVPNYSIAGISAGYTFNKNANIRAGISNLLDKKIYREGVGARTYNEPGRAYYARLTASF